MRRSSIPLPFLTEGNSRGALVAVVALALGGCKKSPVIAADAGAPERVPAPQSSLARELGTDDAGRGEYRAFDDGPWCGFAPRVDRGKRLGPSSYATWLGFFETTAPPRDGPRVYERAAIALTLTGPSRGSTEVVTPLALSLANGSAQRLNYALPGDGSFEHWRVPFFDLYVREGDSGPTYRWSMGETSGRCGQIGYRTAEDYAVLPAGAKRADPFGPRSHESLGPVFTKPGHYTLWVVYASSCIAPERSSSWGRDRDARPPADLFEGTIASNAVTIDISR